MSSDTARLQPYPLPRCSGIQSAAVATAGLSNHIGSTAFALDLARGY